MVHNLKLSRLSNSEILLLCRGSGLEFKKRTLFARLFPGGISWSTGERPGCRLSLVSIGYLQLRFLLHHHATNADIMLASRRKGKAVVGANEYSLYAAMRATRRRCRQVLCLLHVVKKGGCSYTLFFFSTAHNNMDSDNTVSALQYMSLSPSTARGLRCPPKMNIRTGEKKSQIFIQ